MARMHNFSAGPAVLPLSVIEQLSGALADFQGCGLGLMEMSHRGKVFDDVIVGAEARFRRLIGVPDDYAVLFLQGGASLQFYMSALNLLGPGESVDYLMTGVWSTKALKEAKRCSDAVAVWEQDGTPDHVPAPGSYTIRDEAKYLHYTSNNTIYGTQFPGLPESDGRPLVGDLSSDIASRPVDVSRHAVIYAGAQKNLGPSGVCMVILSPWAVEQSRRANGLRPGGIPSMLNYDLMVKKASMFNTPNTFGIYALDRVLAWVDDMGGVEAMTARNMEKSGLLYAELDRSDFWRPHARPDSRSQMNVTWRTPTPELDAAFVAESTAAGLSGLKGHRSVGGIRASLYNACSRENVVALVSFMQDFEQRKG
ncbi:MAG: phosphoserine aminotransferase [Myxococcota bacterium]|jgi:phosphoserine aminotransferase